MNTTTPPWQQASTQYSVKNPSEKKAGRKLGQAPRVSNCFASDRVRIPRNACPSRGQLTYSLGRIISPIQAPKIPPT
jgi:hypothetical protein